MKARILPPEEWPRLIGTEAEMIFPLVDPIAAEILVVEDGDEIVGTWMAMKIVHAECIWIAPKHRGTFGVAKRLLRGMREIASRWGVKSVWTNSIEPHVSDLIERLGGVQIKADSFMMPTGKESMPWAAKPRPLPQLQHQTLMGGPTSLTIRSARLRPQEETPCR